MKRARAAGWAREAQSLVNAPTLLKLLPSVEHYSSPSLLIVTTNQVDAMVNLIANHSSKIDKNKIIGISGIVDNARFKYCLATETNTPSSCISSKILGFHNKDMFYSSTKLTVLGKRIEDNKKLLFSANKALTKTISYGQEISNLQKAGKHPAVARTSGSSLLTAEAIARTCIAYLTNGNDFIESFSIPVDAEHTKQLGINAISTGLPIRISKGNIERVYELDLTTEEVNHMRKSSERFAATFNNLSRRLDP